MAGEDAEFAQRAGDREHGDAARVDLRLGADDVALHEGGHGVSPSRGRGTGVRPPRPASQPSCGRRRYRWLVEMPARRTDRASPKTPNSRRLFDAGEVQALAALDEGPHLFEALQPLGGQCHDHPPMIPKPPPSGSFLVGRDGRQHRPRIRVTLAAKRGVGPCGEDWMKTYMKCAVGLPLAAILGACGGGVPDCGDSDTVDEVQGLLDRVVGNTGWRFTLGNVVTLARDENSDKYTCQAPLTFYGGGKEVIAPFTFELWPVGDRDESAFLVVFEGVPGPQYNRDGITDWLSKNVE